METLVKILKLEREQGCENRAVIGGLGTFGPKWQKQAADQARRPEHVVLAEELGELLHQYEEIDNRTERLKQINYMLDRITGRVPVPDDYAERLEEVKSTFHLRQNRPATSDDKKGAGDKEGSNKGNGVRYRVGSDGSHVIESDRRRPSKGRARPAIDYDRSYDDGYKPVQSGKPDVKPLPTLARPPRKPRGKINPDEARAALQDLQKSVTAIKGIGKALAEKLKVMGIYTVADMLYYLPRRYDDYTRLAYVAKLEPDTVATVIGTVQHTEIRAGRNNRRDFFMTVSDGSATLNVTCFGQHFLIRNIRQGQQIVLSGKVTTYRDRLQMTNPEWEALDSENLHTIGIVPVYRLTEGVKPRGFRRSMKRAVDEWSKRIPDYIPEATLERAELADLDWTMRTLHFPEGWDHLNHAKRRFIFDELLLLQLAILRKRRDWQAVPGQQLEVDDGFLEDFVETVFPFPLTGAQQRAVADIRTDIAKKVPMNRLIQGDVGSGKTAVAVTAIGMTLANGKQAAMMAPTSILAEQHYRGIENSLLRMPGEHKPVIALLTSALNTSERQSIYRGLADGSIDVVIGTHAVIQEGVEFKDLGLAIIDEQHRFGVAQRGALRGKGHNPHLLVMTATPIPRTLALTMHADLDLTIIDEKPPGRYPVQTRLLKPSERERAFQFIEDQVKQGRQAFVIHPLVEASEKIEARSATEAYEELQQVFHRYRVCLLHGRMKSSEKDEIMGAFADQQYDVMVTTSVAEVGVDIPNASVIVIEGANRFGLSQLHQFRGRVGRGQFQSTCLLIPDNDTPESRERLSAMEQTDDGFRLAELDWKQRGAGDLLGTKQSGGTVLQLAEAMTPELVALAQQEARTIYAEDAYLQSDEHALLAERVRMLHNDEGDMS